jgi:peptide/nickel transport system substrate-binding protein
MENRFTLKDLVLFTLVIGLIVLVVLSMFQYDRQWEQITLVNTQLREQTRDLARIRSLMERGVPLAPSANPTAQAPAAGAGPSTAAADATDPFQYVRAARALPDFAEGDYLVDVFAVTPDKLTPLISTDIYATEVQDYVLETLAERDLRTLEWSPKIARSWTITDNQLAWAGHLEAQAVNGLTRELILRAVSSAGDDARWTSFTTALATEREKGSEPALTEVQLAALRQAAKALPPATIIRFNLRPGVTFSDGHPLTADDVLFTYGWIMNPAVEVPRMRVYYEKVMSVRKLDDLTVEFAFSEPYFKSFEVAAGLPIVPAHFYGKLEPQEFNRSTGLLLGSGPYRLADPTTWRPEPGKPIELLRNDRYWGEQGAFDKLIWRVIDNESARLTTFKNGDIDVFYPTPEQHKSMVADGALTARTQHFEFDRPQAGYIYIAWNQDTGGKPTKFADKRVRQAMTMLTDRARVVNEVFLGLGSVATGPFSPLTKQADKSVEAWPYDPQRAKALLKEAGWEDRNGDGVLENAAGEPFEFRLSYPSSSDTFNRVVLFFQDTFARAGVKVIPDPNEWNVMIQRIDKRDFEAISLGWGGSIETDPYQIFHSSQIVGTGDNFVGYRSEEADRLIETGRQTVDEEGRTAVWHQLHRVLHEDQPYTFLLSRKSLVFVDGRLANVQTVKLGLNQPTEWFVPAGKQKWTQTPTAGQ